ncbi:MAG: hypothetical protein N2561_02575 [Bacteroidetes bacterium]|nr:hypothetical protein [Rhodothermia bacterium]MCS7155545.1 hypothetical protein [Bacteroidota bacterium]MCX7906403.1 hypothetical protein [Bacteroidota bacterium]MDW8137315.1 hypothetical protein [Bacteroidota bacterium]MDW8284815.1 hypothetical protein [Bacteroidota bacterium]
MRRSWLWLCVGLWAGCGTPHLLEVDRYGPLHRDVTLRARRQEAQVRFADGRQWRLRGFQLTADSLKLPDGRAYALRELDWIRFRNAARGFWKGAAAGAGVGLLPAMALLAQLARDGSCDGPACALLAPAVIVVIFGGAALSIGGGALLGGFIGAWIGDPDTYYVRSPGLEAPPRGVPPRQVP